MANLTLATKEKLDTIVNTRRFERNDHLLAVYAFAVLGTGRRNELREDDLKALSDSYLAQVYAGDFQTRQANRDGLARIANSCLYETQKTMQEQEDDVKWLFETVEELVSNLDNISNVRFLKAIRNVEIAQQEVLDAIEALENSALIEEAEKTAETAKVLGLPVLKGTPKQVEWAERIRKRCLETMNEKELGRGLKSEKASYWIEKYKHVLPPRR
ncbi:hypothetical protein [Pasteurella multocida]|uniref:hypothetical protein n=1 Tax=Pasteurella multocida TaxID=747 RepID=UPI003311B7F3|nr:hypothetical protein [Pasteurella multocida]